jgi:hypothetical protein
MPPKEIQKVGRHILRLILLLPDTSQEFSQLLQAVGVEDNKGRGWRKTVLPPWAMPIYLTHIFPATVSYCPQFYPLPLTTLVATHIALVNYLKIFPQRN